MTLREQLFDYIKKKYKADPEYLWMRFPDYAVFRHADNEKWFGLVMNIPMRKLGMDGDDNVDILNVKLSEPLLVDMLIRQSGYFRGYHISRGNWVSILLDGTVPFDDICRWLEESYLTTASKEKKQKLRPPKEWLIPANPKYYDIEQAFKNANEIDWKQGAGINKGDTVFIYLAAPVSAILYKCRVTEANIPFKYDDGNVRMKALMKLKLQKRYKPTAFTLEKLRDEHGIYSVRGPRSVPYSLSEALKL
ncbi:MAG: MmcQ/YjbR family DNA-binding protein [Eubacterium sp.]|nr:MmcQ/YjbR family DNA-binding protein [Eubacterium sp.]